MKGNFSFFFLKLAEWLLLSINLPTNHYYYLYFTDWEMRHRHVKEIP